MSEMSNVLMVQEVARGLKELRDEVVFVGGAVTSLYIDDEASPEPTASDDVDFVVEISSHVEFEEFEKNLSKLGFNAPNPYDEEDAIICRKYYKGIQVDVMPTDEKLLSFSNPWFSEGVSEKEEYELPDGTKISIFSPAYFLASKFVALNNRKEKDIRYSQDLEDIANVLDGCSRIEDSLEDCSSEAKAYVQKEFKKLLRDEDTLSEAFSGFLNASIEAEDRAYKIVSRVKGLIS